MRYMPANVLIYLASIGIPRSRIWLRTYHGLFTTFPEHSRTLYFKISELWYPWCITIAVYNTANRFDYHIIYQHIIIYRPLRVSSHKSIVLSVHKVKWYYFLVRYFQHYFEPRTIHATYH